MSINNKPATPLPWKSVQADQDSFSTFWVLDEEREDADIDDQNAAYLAHAANAYPDLVAALRNVAIGKPYAKRAADLLRELGEA